LRNGIPTVVTADPLASTAINGKKFTSN